MLRTGEFLLCPCLIILVSWWAGLRQPALLSTQRRTEYGHGKHSQDSSWWRGITPDKTPEEETLGWAANSKDRQTLSWHCDYVCSCLTYQLNHIFLAQNTLRFHPWGWLKHPFIQHLTILYLNCAAETLVPDHWVWILSPPLSSCVTHNKQYNFTEPQSLTCKMK